MTEIKRQYKSVSGALGAEVSGIDLSQPLTTEDITELTQALAENEVLFFREQPMTPEQQRRFSGYFGPLQQHRAYPHPEGVPEVTILEHTAEKPSKIEVWHADMTFRPDPPLGSILQGIVCPEVGGDTLWSSMTAAWEGLSDRWQQFLSGLTAVHDFRHGFKESLAEPGGRERLKPMLDTWPPVEHPVVRVHPVTGKPLLFVNALFTTHIQGMKPQESRAVLNFLFEHCREPQFTCRFRWEPHSVAFWDNRSTQHKPVNDHGSAHRKLHRCTVEGEIPKGL